MKITVRIFAGLFFVLAVSAWAKPTSELEMKLQAILDKGVSNPITADFLDTHMANDLRHGLDRAVTQRIEALPNYALWKAASQEMLDRMVQEYDIDLKSGAAVAMDGEIKQAPELVQMMREVAAAQNFSPEYRENAVVMVDPTQEINAYTYSGGPYIRFALNRGLLNSFAEGAERIAANARLSLNTEQQEPDLNPENIKNMAVAAVMGHELGHIKAGHVRNQIILISIFKATGISLIDQARMSPSDKEKTKRKFQKDLRTQLRMSLEHSYGEGHGYRNPKALNSIVDNLMAQIDALGGRMMRRYGPAKMLGIAASINQAFAKKEDGGDDSDQNGGQEPDDKPRKISMEDILKFKEQLVRYGRSCETTADRFGQVATSTRASEYADMLLAGVESREAAEVQARQQHDAFITRPDLLESVSQKTHPGSLYRILEYKNFEHDPFHRIYTDPYLKALHTYLAVAAYIEELQIKQDQDGAELAETRNAAIDRDLFKKVERELANYVIDEIRKDLEDPSRRNQTILETAKYFGYRELWQRMGGRSRYNVGIAHRTNLEGGLFAQLKSTLNDVVMKIQDDYEKAISGSNMKNSEKTALATRAKEEVEDLVKTVNLLYAYSPPSDVNDAREQLEEITQSRLARKEGTSGGSSAAPSTSAKLGRKASTMATRCRALLTGRTPGRGPQLQLKSGVFAKD